MGPEQVEGGALTGLTDAARKGRKRVSSTSSLGAGPVGKAAARDAAHESTEGGLPDQWACFASRPLGLAKYCVFLCGKTDHDRDDVFDDASFIRWGYKRRDGLTQGGGSATTASASTPASTAT